MLRHLKILAVVLAASAFAWGASDGLKVPIGDITSIAGVRDNMLVGYGLVVGLNGTGDRRQTLFTTQTLGNILQKMGVTIAPAQVTVLNIAAVFVTATLPPFAHPGMRIDATVSSTGDARSLSGGLHGPDGAVYAEAQGPTTGGGFSADGDGALGLGIDGAVGAMQDAEQEQAAGEAAGVAGGADGGINAHAGVGEGGQGGGDEDGGDVQDGDLGGRDGDAHFLQDVAQGLGGEEGLAAVAGAVEADHEAVADEHVVAHPGDGGDV